MGERRKPWLKYENPDKPARNYSKAKEKPRQLIWARFWLVVGFKVGAHRFYLWDYRGGLLWIAVYFLLNLIVIVLSSVILRVAPENSVEPILLIPVLLTVFAIGAYEWRKLPERIRTANREEFGSNALEKPKMQGRIGRYSALRPTFMIACFGFFIFLGTSFLRDPFPVLGVLLFCASSIIFIIHFILVGQRPDLELPND